MNFTFIYIAIAAIVVIAVLSLKFKSKFESISSSTFDKMSNDKNTIILDVRTKGETQQGKIKNAKVIDVKSSTFVDEISKLDKDKTYLVYCRSGMRSRMACTIMQKNGFNNIYNLTGGYMNYKK